MGIDIEGGMIVGEEANLIDVPEGCDDEFYEWAENVGMDSYAEHYDADEDYKVYGFPVKDVAVDDMCGEWIEDVKKKADTFFKLTGVKARLIGMQNVW